LRTAQREFVEAERLLVRAGRLCRQMGNAVGLAKTLLQRGNVADYAGDSAAAVARYREAAGLLDPGAQSRLYLMSQHNLANNLVQLGRVGEASAVVAANRELYAANDDPVNRLRRWWVEGKIARAEKRWEEAERLLGEARAACLGQGMRYDGALAGLDLAELFLATGRTAEVKRLAREMGKVFAGQRVHREALAALLLFGKAAAREKVTAELLARLRRYLLLAQHDPSFRFQACAGA
jgi:tetratricopeptide (TPR) repeat protein